MTLDAPSENLRRIGGIAGPVLGLALYASGVPEALGAEGRITAALAVWMAIWWMAEVFPLAVTSLLPVVVLPLCDVLSFEQTVAPFSSPILFLFLGGFLLSTAMQKWGLHRRFSLALLQLGGNGAPAVLGMVMLATAFLAFWMSNTATAVMMLPLALSLAPLLAADAQAEKQLSKALVLGVAYAAALGGLGTFVGTPTNAILQGYVVKTYGISLDLAAWMLFGVPTVVLIVGAAWGLLARQFLRGVAISAEKEQRMAAALEELGPLQRAEYMVMAVFMLCISLWLFSGLPDAVVAILGALLLLVVPLRLKPLQMALTWKEAEQIPWGVLVFFGGSLSLSAALTQTGVTAWLGQELTVFEGLPLWVFVAGVVVLIILVSEMMSNVATITAFLPVLGGVSEALHVNPLYILIPATLAASCGFMLPGASAANALAYGTGHLKVPEMVRAGMLLDILAALMIFAVSLLLIPHLF